MIATDSGMYARPAFSAENPSTFCMYSVMKKNIENSDIATKIAVTLAPVSVRLRKIEKGTSG